MMVKTDVDSLETAMSFSKSFCALLSKAKGFGNVCLRNYLTDFHICSFSNLKVNRLQYEGLYCIPIFSITF